MAKTMACHPDDPSLVGRHCYPVMMAQHPAVIIADHGPDPAETDRWYRLVTILKLDGTTEETTTFKLQDYDALIEEHYKRYTNHTQRANRLDELKRGRDGERTQAASAGAGGADGQADSNQ